MRRGPAGAIDAEREVMRLRVSPAAARLWWLWHPPWIGVAGQLDLVHRLRSSRSSTATRSAGAIRCPVGGKGERPALLGGGGGCALPHPRLCMLGRCEGGVGGAL